MSYQSTVLADNPTLLWLLNETSGTAAADATGNGNAGTYQGGYTQGAAGPLFQVNATTFGGVNGDVFKNASAALSGAFTIETWFKTSATGRSIGGDNANNFVSNNMARGVFIDSSGNLGLWVYTGVTSFTAISSGQSYGDGNWHYLVTTVDGSNRMRVYADSVQVATTLMNAAPASTTSYWIAGAEYAGNFPNVSNVAFSGQMAAFAIYPVALTQAQVTAHWQASGYAPAGGRSQVPDDKSYLKKLFYLLG